MFNDDMPRKKPDKEFPRRLDALSIGELDEYVEDLKAEIARVEADKAKKKASRDAAASVFK